MNPQDPYQPQQPYQPQPTPQNPPQPSPGGQYTVVPPIVANSTTTGHNPYEFIFNGQPQKAPVTSLTKRIVIVLLGLVVLAMLFAVVSSLLSAGNSENQALLKTVTQQQQDIILLATDGSKNIQDPALKNTATTLQFATTSSQKELLDYASSNGISINDKELLQLHDAATDTLLTDAKATSTYDTTWKQAAQAALEEHAASVKKLYDQSKNNEFKKLLQTAYTNALLVQSNVK